MRVLIINPILYTSETDDIPKVVSIKDTMIYTLCMGFVKNGDEPVLVAAKDYKPNVDEEYPFTIQWMECGLPKICKPRCLPLLKGLGGYIRRNRDAFDMIITSEVFSLPTLSSVLWNSKKTLIWHELGAHNNLMKKIPSKVWYNMVARLFMKHVRVVPRSQQAREFISKYCSNVLDITIDHGVDIEKIGHDVNKDNYFVVISQLIERKRIDGIISKFYDFLQMGQAEYTLKIIGAGEQQGALEEQVQRLQIADKVMFYGKRTHEEIAPILMKAKALLVNTQKDNSMVSIVESIAAGTPVLTTTVPFNSYYIEKEQLGMAKDDWDGEDIKMMVENNAFLVERCVQYREKLSSKYCAKQFREIAAQ